MTRHRFLCRLPTFDRQGRPLYPDDLPLGNFETLYQKMSWRQPLPLPLIGIDKSFCVFSNVIFDILLSSKRYNRIRHNASTVLMGFQLSGKPKKLNQNECVRMEVGHRSVILKRVSAKLLHLGNNWYHLNSMSFLRTFAKVTFVPPVFLTGTPWLAGLVLFVNSI